MAWIEPKTDWYGYTDSDGVYHGDRFDASHYNRLINNVLYLLNEYYILYPYEEILIDPLYCTLQSTWTKVDDDNYRKDAYFYYATIHFPSDISNFEAELDKEYNDFLDAKKVVEIFSMVKDLSYLKDATRIPQEEIGYSSHYSYYTVREQIYRTYYHYYGTYYALRFRGSTGGHTPNINIPVFINSEKNLNDYIPSFNSDYTQYLKGTKKYYYQSELSNLRFYYIYPYYPTGSYSSYQWIRTPYNQSSLNYIQLNELETEMLRTYEHLNEQEGE